MILRQEGDTTEIDCLGDVHCLGVLRALGAWLRGVDFAFRPHHVDRELGLDVGVEILRVVEVRIEVSSESALLQLLEIEAAFHNYRLVGALSSIGVVG